MKKKTPTMPFLIRVEDYRRFGQIQKAIRLINPNVRVTELDPIETLDKNGDHTFISGVALVHEGRKPNKRTMVDIFKTKIHDVSTTNSF